MLPRLHDRSLLIPALLLLLLPLGAGCSRDDAPATPLTADQAAKLPVEYALLTPPPNVPPPITRRYRAHVIVDLEVQERVGHLADGVEYEFWTFGGTVPGLFIRVREGDYVEFRLHNSPNSKMAHNIDLHAVSGPGGGAVASFTAPGHTSTFCFTALNPGLFVYHCATAPVPMHVGNGMYGMILVEPRDGLPKVDREYYVMQGEFYTAGRFGEGGLQPFDSDKADNETPPYVVFNGRVGALTGDRALRADAGQTVRIYFGNGGPNLISSFHVIGQIFNTVYEEGGTSVRQHNVQTTLVPPGGATIVEIKTRVPGDFAIVDHSLSRAFGKGAIGTLAVGGEGEGATVFSGKISDTLYAGNQLEMLGIERPEAGGSSEAALAAEAPPGAPLTQALQIARGKQVFFTSCYACHQPNGRGIPGVFPPLAGSDYIRAHRSGIASIPVHGLHGPIMVNGRLYNNVMPPQPFTDEQIANALTYVLNSWGNDSGRVLPSDVARARKAPVDAQGFAAK